MDHPLSPRRLLAVLLLPASMVPVFVLAPSLARAPATLVLRAERFIAPAHPRVHRAPPPPGRYPAGASRFGVDAMDPAAGALTPKVGVSPVAEPVLAGAGAERSIVLISDGQKAGGSP
ncbi:MAG: hypothetical protein ACHQE6_10905 [Solirubrobacterales bacterium]